MLSEKIRPGNQSLSAYPWVTPLPCHPHHLVYYYLWIGGTWRNDYAKQDSFQHTHYTLCVCVFVFLFKKPKLTENRPSWTFFFKWFNSLLLGRRFFFSRKWKMYIKWCKHNRMMIKSARRLWFHKTLDLYSVKQKS